MNVQEHEALRLSEFVENQVRDGDDNKDELNESLCGKPQRLVKFGLVDDDTDTNARGVFGYITLKTKVGTFNGITTMTGKTKDTTSEIDGKARYQVDKVFIFDDDDKVDELVLEKKKTKKNNGTKQIEKISVNIQLVEALQQILGYAKFIKDLFAKKRTISFDLVDNLHHCSTIATSLLVEKKEDPGTFTIPCTIGAFDFPRALCDLGASIDLIPLAIYR
ncbi:uncharacterized protein LOC129892871 [Solanum dulcamara]|uniref:uncharacterized protein LOC129892871 n=1 Tax=Solanum dulcamara TaxID=45834 RepID=UPI002486839F|nr:uncharacterized protein LOC129892871 [Solanum dulcamara]